MLSYYSSVFLLLSREASDREAEVGYGIQGRVGGSGQLHEHAVGKRRGVRRRDLRRSTRRNFDQVSFIDNTYSKNSAMSFFWRFRASF